MNIKDILDIKGTQELLTVDPSETLTDAIKKLCELNIGALVVQAGSGNIVGIISERDILHQCGKQTDLSKLTVADVMTADVITVDLGKDMQVAMELMCTAHIRHLPVVDSGKVHGIVTIGDVVKTLRETDDAKFHSFFQRFAEKEEAQCLAKQS